MFLVECKLHWDEINTEWLYFVDKYINLKTNK